MHHLRSFTKDLLTRAKAISGKPIQLLRDEQLSVLATLHMARGDAAFHILRYRPSNEPLDYLVAYQLGFLLRLYVNPPAQRFDLAPRPHVGAYVQALLTAGQALSTSDRTALPAFASRIATWALMCLRSLPIGMRIDQWIGSEFPDLRSLQEASIAQQQQQNVAIFSLALGRLAVPTPLMGPIAAYALFADRLLGTHGYAIPFEAVGLQGAGQDLLALWDQTNPAPAGDGELIDQWAQTCAMRDWFDWVPHSGMKEI